MHGDIEDPIVDLAHQSIVVANTIENNQNEINYMFNWFDLLEALNLLTQALGGFYLTVVKLREIKDMPSSNHLILNKN